MANNTSENHEEKEKRRVAQSSVVAAVFLTGVKIVVGILTGSLGILAEAAHSGLDLVAAFVTYLAVRVSGKPADERHPYGHGKIENLSALFETLLLLATCVWIIYEAAQRLLVKEVAIEANAWAFLVMVVSIAVDFTRSRALMRAAKKYDSQALEADALHFSTDIWSSTVVIVGLVLVRLGEAIPGLGFLHRADAIAALGVALIVLYVSLEMGWRTVMVLLDSAPPEVAPEIAGHVLALSQVEEVGSVRMRRAGPNSFVDLVVKVSPQTTVEESHAIASQVEDIVEEIIPRSDVMVHVEPSLTGSSESENKDQLIREVAYKHGLRAHAIRILEDGATSQVEVHAEIDRSLSVAKAHEIVSQFEAEVRKLLGARVEVVTHIEPDSAEPQPAAVSISDSEAKKMIQRAQSLAQGMFGEGNCHKVRIHTVSGRPSLSLHCVLPADMTVNQAHELTESFEDALRERYPVLDRVVVHAEPPD